MAGWPREEAAVRAMRPLPVQDTVMKASIQTPAVSSKLGQMSILLREVPFHGVAARGFATPVLHERRQLQDTSLSMNA